MKAKGAKAAGRRATADAIRAVGLAKGGNLAEAVGELAKAHRNVAGALVDLAHEHRVLCKIVATVANEIAAASAVQAGELTALRQVLEAWRSELDAPDADTKLRVAVRRK